MCARPAQRISSAATSLNQVAAAFTQGTFHPGTLNLDYGGGRYDRATQYLADRQVTNRVFDPYNRSVAENLETRLAIVRAGGADTVTVNNVLNVIAEPLALLYAVAQAANALKADGTAYFLVHEGDRSGRGAPTTRGYQRNDRAEAYLPWVARSFERVSRSGNLLMAREPQHTIPSLFAEATVLSDILAACQAGGLRRGLAGAGKVIGGHVYVHRSAEDVIPAPVLSSAKHLLPAVAYAVVKWTPATGAISLIESPDFLTAPEPIVGTAYRVHDGTIRMIHQKADPQIYHHKWLFVRPDFRGFDVAQSMLRSLQWMAYPGIDRTRIGQQAFWHATLAQQGLAP